MILSAAYGYEDGRTILLDTVGGAVIPSAEMMIGYAPIHTGVTLGPVIALGWKDLVKIFGARGMTPCLESFGIYFQSLKYPSFYISETGRNLVVTAMIYGAGALRASFDGGPLDIQEVDDHIGQVLDRNDMIDQIRSHYAWSYRSPWISLNGERLSTGDFSEKVAFMWDDEAGEFVTSDGFRTDDHRIMKQMIYQIMEGEPLTDAEAQEGTP